MRSLFLLFVLTTPWIALRAQPPNTVTATVSTTQPAPAGTANLRIQFFDANLASTIDAALGVLGGVGVTAANLTGISVSISQGFVITQYDFLLPVPAAEFAAARDRLISAQRNLATSTSQGLTWSSTVAASDEEITRALQQAMPRLVAQARAQAAVLAAAVEKSAGDVISIATPAVTNSGLNLVIGLTVTYALQ